MSNRNLHPTKYITVPEFVPQRLPLREGQKCVNVYVEGYDDVAFWRTVFDEFECANRTFTISVPPRKDLAKGKKVLLDMLPRTSDDKIVCVDSDFDYLLNGATAQSRRVLDAQWLFHSYTYSIENYLCYAPSLRSICTKATKNDMPTLDFEWFMAEYSKIIYPVFLWYAYSAKLEQVNLYKLDTFRNDVRILYIDLENGGRETLAWVKHKITKRLDILRRTYPTYRAQIEAAGEEMRSRDLYPDNTYLFMQGHTLFENVAIPILESICNKLKNLELRKINDSSTSGVPLANALDNYRNASQLSIRDLLLTNTDYRDCFLYKRMRDDIRSYVAKVDGKNCTK